MTLEEAQGLVGCKIVVLRSLPDLPRGSDWVEEHIVARVVSVNPTPSAPRGALHFWAREGGFRCLRFEDITEVIGAIGVHQPRQTRRELVAEQRATKRSERLAARAKRRAQKALAPPSLPEPKLEPVRRKRRRKQEVIESQPQPQHHETVFERRQRKKREAQQATGHKRRRRA